MAILKLLVELYEYADLKLNLKFEIEVLCKTLSLELKRKTTSTKSKIITNQRHLLDIEATSILKDRRPNETTHRNNIMPSLPKTDHSLSASIAARSPINTQQATAAGLDGDVDDSHISMVNLAPYITFNSQVILYSAQPATKRLALEAISRSIREVWA